MGRKCNIGVGRCFKKKRLYLIRLQQQVIKVLKNRHILWLWVIEIFVVNQPYTTVNNGFLHRLQALLTAHDPLTQAEDKVRLE